MTRRPIWPWGRFGTLVAVAVTVYLSSLGVIGVRAVMLLDGGCPRGALARQRDGLAAVKRQLPAATIRKEILNECDSGDEPFFTVLASGTNDPVQELVDADSAWSPEAREPGDPERRGSDASRPFKSARLSVSSRPYSRQDQREQPEPTVDWFLSITVT
jgi:hypothetical protein